jgi:hypothetical protein
MLFQYPLFTFEEFIPIDESFRAHYGVYNDLSEWIYIDGIFSNPDHFNWKPHQYVNTNLPFPKEGTENGVDFSCYEHATVCINGSADYDLEKNDDSEKHVSKWTFGVHNVDNGWGYLPDKSMHCRNFKNFETCCILQKEGGRDLTLPYTKFEVLSESGVITTSREYKWIHVAAGSVELNDSEYDQKQTMYSVATGSQLNLAEKTICIAAY